MIEVLQYAHCRDLGLIEDIDNHTRPAIIAIDGQPFTSNVPSSIVEARDINQTVDKHTIESER
jgi:hypothetical protein